MALFGHQNTEEVDRLKSEIDALQQGNKTGSTELQKARQQAADLELKIAALKVELEVANAAVQRARRRQKNSVERANRFKKRAGNPQATD